MWWCFFLCRGQLGQAGSIPAHGYCDILLHTGSSKESHVISQNADIRRSAKDNKQKIDSAIYI